MFRTLALWVGIVSIVPAIGAPSSTAAERLVVAEMSRVRLDPRGYATWLRTLVPYFEGDLWKRPGQIPLQTQEGVAALHELIDFLRQSRSPGPLRWTEGLSRAARDLVQEQGPTGQTGHVGPGGSTLQQRVLKHGLHLSTVGEVIHYSAEEAQWIVMQLLIDDGVPSRGHRKAIFNPAFHVAGAATGPHAEYGSMTVVDLADGFVANPGTD